MKHTLNKQTKLKIAAIKIIFFALVLNFNALGQELINFETVKPLYEVNDKSSTHKACITYIFNIVYFTKISQVYSLQMRKLFILILPTKV